MKPILIIDADQNYSRLLTQNLRREGYAVMQAGNLDEAKMLLADSEPFVIASALLLPDGNGFEFLDYVHEKSSDLPVVVFSNYGQDVVAESILQRGAARYFCRSEIDRLATRNHHGFCQSSLVRNGAPIPASSALCMC